MRLEPVPEAAGGHIILHSSALVFYGSNLQNVQVSFFCLYFLYVSVFFFFTLLCSFRSQVVRLIRLCFIIHRCPYSSSTVCLEKYRLGPIYIYIYICIPRCWLIFSFRVRFVRQKKRTATSRAFFCFFFPTSFYFFWVMVFMSCTLFCPIRMYIHYKVADLCAVVALSVPVFGFPMTR